MPSSQSSEGRDSQKPPNVPVVRDMCATKKQEGKVKFESGIKKYTFRAGFELICICYQNYIPLIQYIFQIVNIFNMIYL